MTIHPRILFAAALCGAACAQAHVVLEYQVAPAGSAYKATFKVGHGCGEAPTKQVSVAIPAGVTAAHPMPKPGWSLAIERGPEPQPLAQDGRTPAESVVRVTWTARTAEDMLASAHYDEFVLSARLPQQAGRLYWPVTQACEPGREDWVEIPATGQDAGKLRHPAAVLDVLPAGGDGGHRH